MTGVPRSGKTLLTRALPGIPLLRWLLESFALIQIGRLGCQTKFLPKIPQKLADEVSSQHRTLFARTAKINKTTILVKEKIWYCFPSKRCLKTSVLILKKYILVNDNNPAQVGSSYCAGLLSSKLWMIYEPFFCANNCSSASINSDGTNPIPFG